MVTLIVNAEDSGPIGQAVSSLTGSISAPIALDGIEDSGSRPKMQVSTSYRHPVATNERFVST